MFVDLGVGEEGDKQQEFGDRLEAWAWKMLTLLEDFVTPLGCDDNPLELHCIKKKWRGSSGWNADAHMYLYLQFLGHVCGDTVN